jgi:uncharacterized SAM-binding protein YcdF (DUF218 family)
MNTLDYDAVIVLAHEMDSDGVLNEESIARASLAYEIFSRQNFAYLVTSGWNYRGDCSIRICDAFKKYLVSNFGVHSKKVIAEPNARDTVGDAFFTKVNLATPLKWRKICIITSAYHVSRANEIFQLVYGPDFIVDVFGANVVVTQSKNLHELQSLDAFRKTFLDIKIGDIDNIYSRLRSAHPFYNGAVGPKI